MWFVLFVNFPQSASPLSLVFWHCLAAENCHQTATFCFGGKNLQTICVFFSTWCRLGDFGPRKCISLVISYELAPLYLDIGWREGLVNNKVENGRHLWVTLHVILSQNSTVNYVTSCFVSASHLPGEAAFPWWQKLYCSLLHPLHSPQDLPSRRTQLTFAE